MKEGTEQMTMMKGTCGTFEISKNEIPDWNFRTIPIARSKGGVKGITTSNSVILAEAKWMSGVGRKFQIMQPSADQVNS